MMLLPPKKGPSPEGPQNPKPCRAVKPKPKAVGLGFRVCGFGFNGLGFTLCIESAESTDVGEEAR